MNKKYITLALILLVITVMIPLQFCSFKGFAKQVSTWEEHMPASWGNYKIDTIANEPLLISVWTPTEPPSGCGLANSDFMDYAKSKIDRTRKFQFIVFSDGKPAVGERCFRKAFIFYLKEKS